MDGFLCICMFVYMNIRPDKTPFFLNPPPGCIVRVFPERLVKLNEHTSSDIPMDFAFYLAKQRKENWPFVSRARRP